MILIKLGGVLLAFLLLTACQTIQPSIKEGVTYRHDLSIEVNGVPFTGTGVAQRADKYLVKVTPRGNINRIIWQTCHQETVVDKPDPGFWDRLTKSQIYYFWYVPAPGLEDTAACALEVSVLEEKKQRDGFAVIDFTDRRPEVDLTANLLCNDRNTRSDGVSFCQSAAGLVQQIDFDYPVVQVGSKPECDVMKPYGDDKTRWRFNTAKGKCTYYFVSNQRALNKNRRVHRLNTVGYTDILGNP